MKIFISSLLILLISNSHASTCVADAVEIDDKTYQVCRSGKYDFLSAGCTSVQACFPVKGIEVVLLPNQNPAFTLCEKIKGEGVSGRPKSLKTVESFCLLGGKIVDMNQLMKSR